MRNPTIARFILTLLLLWLNYIPGFAQSKMIHQTVFYDAQLLYYALKGYNAYPIYIRSESEPVFSSIGSPEAHSLPQRPTPGSTMNTGPDAGLSSSAATRQLTVSPTVPLRLKIVRHYKLIHSVTGSVLKADVSEADLNRELNEFKITDSTEKLAIIDEVLARNDGTAAGNTFDALRARYQQEPFLSMLFDGNQFARPDQGGGSVGDLSGDGSRLPTINNLAEGLSGFLIDRVNQEVDEAFFIRLQEKLTQLPEIRILFPATFASLRELKITSYQQSLNLLKSNLEVDLRGLMRQLPMLGTVKRLQPLLVNYPDLKMWFAATDAFQAVRNNRTPADILYSIDTATYMQLPVINRQANSVHGQIRLAAELSNALIDINLSDRNSLPLSWVTADQMAEFNNNDKFKLFLGLFLLHIKDVQFGEITLKQVFTHEPKLNELIQYRSLLFNFLQTTQSYRQQLLALQQTVNADDKAENWRRMAETLLTLGDDLIKALPVNQQVKIIRDSVAAVQKRLQPVFTQVTPLIKDLENRDYSKMLIDAQPFLNSMLRVAPAADDSLRSAGQCISELKAVFNRYGPFLADLAEAKDPGEVKAAINAFALPKGSSRIKKEHSFSWGINAYVGIYHAWNLHSVADKLPPNETGITAPLGIAVNWGLRNGNGAVSFYGGLIDVGAVFSYKTNEDQSVQSTLRPGQLLSPSIGVAYAVPMIGKYNVPLTFGINQQWGPQLKQIDVHGNSVLNALTSRINIFIAIDLPIVNFHVSEN